MTRAVRVAQHGVPDRSGPVRAGCSPCLPDDHQVGPGGQADQGPGRVAGHDLLTDRDAGILARPAPHQLGQPGAAAAAAGLSGPGRARRGGQHAALRRLASSNAKVSGSAQSSRSPTPTPTSPLADRGLVADDHDRAGRVGRRVPADRAQRQRGERPDSAGADDQHRRAGSALGDRLRGRPGQRVGHDHQAGRRPGGPGCRRVQGQVAFGADEVGDVIAVRPDLERGHPGRQRRGGHDPQRRGVQEGLAGRPLDRPQGFLGTVRTGHDGLYVHGWPPHRHGDPTPASASRGVRPPGRDQGPRRPGPRAAARESLV